VGSAKDRFDIEAKASGKASRDELVAMMKTMLAERFSLGRPSGDAADSCVRPRSRAA
jgi:hypothetical protein